VVQGPLILNPPCACHDDVISTAQVKFNIKSIIKM
jgi:hypothetical protein